MVLRPRQSAADKSMRRWEPYHFQRDRMRLGYNTRASQPNTNQPNQLDLNDMRQRSNSTIDYWNNVQKQYADRRKSSPMTNLALGR